MKKITIIGAGDIGYPLAKILTTEKTGRIYLTRKDQSKGFGELNENKNCICGYNNVEFVKYSDIIILAVRPSQVEEVLNEIRQHLTERQLLISIVASKTTEFIRERVGSKPRIIRAMPNIGLLCKKSMTFVCLENNDSTQDYSEASSIFSTLGMHQIINEEKMNAATIFGGSMPAIFAKLFWLSCKGADFYTKESTQDDIFMFKRVLAELAAEYGFKDSRAIINQSYDALKILVTHRTKSFDAIIHDVATPGGCTEEVLKPLSYIAFSAIKQFDNPGDSWKDVLSGAIKNGMQKFKVM